MKSSENFENIHTLSLNESEFYPKTSKNTIIMSGSNRYSKLSDS